MEEDLRLEKKAILSLGGTVRLPAGFQPPFRLSHSTAGPGAGSDSMVFGFDGLRVKKSISYIAGEFELSERNGRYSLYRNGELFLDEVQLIPVVFHCPEQAFFNLDKHCIYRCAFCCTPTLSEDSDKHLDDATIVSMVCEAMKEQTVRSISLTSGVFGSVDATVKRFISCIKALREEFPDIPIGIEPYVETAEQIIALKEAGADEIKLNIQTPNRAIFYKVCPDLDFDRILENLEIASEVFGRGKVTSNMIVGMGERDVEIDGMMKYLASIGVIPTIRALRINDCNRKMLEANLENIPVTTPERMIRLAKNQKKVLEQFGLDTNSCKTMCLECRCCDLIPFKDF